MTVFDWTVTGAIVLLGIAMLAHIAKEAKDAHGKTRN